MFQELGGFELGHPMLASDHPPHVRPMGERHPRSRRIRKRPDFLRVQGGGRRIHLPHFVLMALPAAAPRLGVTVTRKVANSVGRSRIKRVVREAYRRHFDLFPPGCEVVVVARQGAGQVSYHELLRELGQAAVAVRRAGGGAA